MANLFGGLESLGLGNLAGMDIFEKKENAQGENGKNGEKAKEVEVKEEDFLLEKTYMCPVCDKEFKTKSIKTGKAKLVNSDSDLRPHYMHIDTLKYDAVVCEFCGYSALTRYFVPGLITSGQIKMIRENICRTFRGIPETGSTYTYDDAILRHRLALASSVVKRAKLSEKSYICLKIGWLIRGKYEEMIAKGEGTAKKDEIEALKQEETQFLANAYQGFLEAFSKENFPMCGMDENTLTYLVAELARRIGKNEEALRWASKVISARDANDRIKDKARELKESIKIVNTDANAEAAKPAEPAPSTGKGLLHKK